MTLMAELTFKLVQKCDTMWQTVIAPSKDNPKQHPLDNFVEDAVL